MDKNYKRIEREIKRLIDVGLVDQHALFDVLYPRYVIHYSVLRDLIGKVKNDGRTR